MKLNIYTVIKYISLVSAPFAPAVFFSHMVYESLTELGANYMLTFIASFFAALALEAVGILAGHIMVDFVGAGYYELAGLSLLILCCYVAIGVYELWATIGAVMFGIAFLVYLLVALKEYGEKLDALQDAKGEERRADKEANLQARLTLKLAEIEAQKQVEIARIAPQQPIASPIAPQRNVQRTSNKHAILQLHAEGLSNAEIAQRLGLNHTTVWRALKNIDRISAD